MDSRQSQGHVSAFEPIHLQGIHNDNDHISREKTELSYQDKGLSESMPDHITQSFDNIPNEETYHSQQNKLNTAVYHSHETSQTEDSTETENSQTSFSGGEELNNISSIKHNTSDSLITTEEFESWIESIAEARQDNDQENTDANELDKGEENTPAYECGSTCLLIDVPDLELGDMAENQSVLESLLVSETRNQLEFGSDEISPIKCPIFRTELGGATVTECGLCICSHCLSQRKADLDKPCNFCHKAISSHYIVEMEQASENVLRSHYLTIEQLEDNDVELTKQIAQQQEEIQGEQRQNQRLQAELTDTVQEVRQLKEKIVNLERFKTKCIQQAKDLQNYQQNIVPSKDSLIANARTEVAELKGLLQEKHQETEQLVSHIGKLDDEISTLRRITVPISQLEVLAGGNLGQSIQELQHFYDREYRSRFDITNKMDVLLQTRLESVWNDPGLQQEIGDQLAAVIMTYTSLVQENANLHKGLRKNQEKIQDLQAELRHTKARIISPENTIRYF